MDLDAIREFHHRRDFLGEQDSCRCGQKMPCDGVVLLAALAAANARAARLEKTLALYADRESYRGTIDYDGFGRVLITNWALSDCGLAARDALAGSGGEGEGG